MNIKPMILALMLGFVSLINASENPVVILVVPWGDAEQEIALTETPSGWQNPQSFQVIDENIELLTSYPGQILSFHGGKLVYREVLPIQGTKDFFLENSQGVDYFLSNTELLRYKGQILEKAWVNKHNLRPNSQIIRVNIKQPAVLINLSETVIPGQEPIHGVLNLQGQMGRIHKSARDRVAVLVDDRILLELSPDRGEWGSGRYLASDNSGQHYVLLENVLATYPLELSRQILVLDSKGKIIKKIEVPAFQHVLVNREFQVDPDGTIYGMITTQTGLFIVEWINIKHVSEENINVKLPLRFRNTVPKPFEGDSRLLRPASEKEDPSSARDMLLDFPPVGRNEAVQTGASYVDLTWVASAANLTSGQITDPDGHPVQTPSWIQIGQNQKMPYKWGGFSTLAGFQSGLISGKYAGDTATDYPSQYAVGVDCSGFVSRCWNMPTHYSTWMMSNTQPLITQPLDSWSDIAAGDAIHKVGHVRLAVLQNTNGSILAVEAGGGWITDYHTYTISQLGDYQPRYYVYMNGMPATIEQPALAGIDIGPASSISWSLSDTTGIAGVNVYQKDIFEDLGWTRLNSAIIPLDQNTFNIPQTDLSLAWELRSVSTENGAEGYPSDAYAAADKASSDTLLIVDGFDRNTGSYPFPYHDFAVRLAESLGRFTLSYVTTDNDAVINGDVLLEQYSAVIWMLGDESTSHETFSVAEQNLVRTYLVGGGKLFVTGSEIGWDLDNQGTTADRNFMNNYLKAGLNSDDSESYTIQGVTDTPFGGLQLAYDDGNDGVYEEDYPDSFTPMGGSQAVLRYTNNQIAGIAYTGLFGAGTVEGQVILLGIPFETIYDADQRLALTTAVLEYFGLSTVLATRETQPPVHFMMKPAFPNPFNSSTVISYVLPASSELQIKVYDLKGRHIQTLVDGMHTRGLHQVSWDATALAGGVYIVSMRTGRTIQTQKILYLK